MNQKRKQLCAALIELIKRILEWKRKSCASCILISYRLPIENQCSRYFGEQPNNYCFLHVKNIYLRSKTNYEIVIYYGKQLSVPRCTTGYCPVPYFLFIFVDDICSVSDIHNVSVQLFADDINYIVIQLTVTTICFTRSYRSYL